MRTRELYLENNLANPAVIIDTNHANSGKQYLEQIKSFEEEEMELGSEFLEMASRLLYIKTVSLLPKHDEIYDYAKYTNPNYLLESSEPKLDKPIEVDNEFSVDHNSNFNYIL